MQHIEQHILELFALGSEKVAERRADIERHLAECHGCRSLVEQMEGSYRSAEARFRELQERPAVVGEAMERVRQKPAPRHESGSAPAKNYRPVTRFQRVQYLVRRHPVIVGSGTFAVFALLAMLIWMPKRAVVKDLNPVQVHPNRESGKLEVYNRNLEWIWDKPASGLAGIIEREQTRGLKHSAAVDLDGDGRNEVVTTVPVVGHGTVGVPILSVFSATGESLFTHPIVGSISYGGREYSDPFGAQFLVAGRFSPSGSNEIIVKVDNLRSPNGLLRISGNNSALGEYWHYGAIHALYAEDVNHDGKTEIVVCGQNDVEENGGERFAFLAVIDPAKITGKTESACTPGFGFARSQAELLYLRFPLTDMDTAYRTGGFIIRTARTGKKGSETWSVWYTGAKEQTDLLSLEYFFSGDFLCSRVKSADQTNRLHDQLVREGRVKGKIDSTYLENLRKGVRYFDGKAWRKEVVWMNPPS